MAKFEMVGEVVGHRMRKIRIAQPGTKPKAYDTYKRMAVEIELEDTETGKPSKAVLLMDPARARTDFEIGDAVNIALEVRQQKLNLGKGARASTASH